MSAVMPGNKMLEKERRHVAFWEMRLQFAREWFETYHEEYFGTYTRDFCEQALGRARARLQRILNARAERARRAAALKRWAEWPHP